MSVLGPIGLTWADVDFEQKRIDVRKQLDPDGTIRHATKTKASTAFVPLLPALERELRELRGRQASVDLRQVHRSALVFTTARGSRSRGGTRSAPSTSRATPQD